MDKSIENKIIMKKQIILENIYTGGKTATIYSKPFTWGEVKALLKKNGIELDDNDILTIFFEEGWYEEDSSREDTYTVKVQRWREETDEELKKREELYAKLQEQGKENRRKQYESLKKEFES